MRIRRSKPALPEARLNSSLCVGTWSPASQVDIHAVAIPAAKVWCEIPNVGNQPMEHLSFQLVGRGFHAYRRAYYLGILH